MIPELLHVKRRPVEQVVGGLLSQSTVESAEAGRKLIGEAARLGIGLRDYLTLAVDTKAGDNAARLNGLNGYEATLAYLNLPFKNDFEQGILLQASSETFQTFPGTRAMFPEVIDDMLRWQNRQNMIETVEGLVSNSRTINQVEMISTVVTDDSAERGTFSVPEMSRVPVRTIRTSQNTVGMFKHGSAYRTSYEFNRRASLDILTPFANRIARELELSKVTQATNVLINGDGTNAAATAIGWTTLGGTANKLSYRPLLKHLVNRAKSSTPVDTIVGNYDMFIEFLFLFTPFQTVTAASGVIAAANGMSEIEAMGARGMPTVGLSMPMLGGAINFRISSGVPANKFVTMTRGETLEELVEAGASLAESEQSILNQTITYVRTEVTGYRLTYGDTRSIIDLAA
jgi:hypothetical protein